MIPHMRMENEASKAVIDDKNREERGTNKMGVSLAETMDGYRLQLQRLRSDESKDVISVSFSTFFFIDAGGWP